MKKYFSISLSMISLALFFSSCLVSRHVITAQILEGLVSLFCFAK